MWVAGDIHYSTYRYPKPTSTDSMTNPHFHHAHLHIPPEPPCSPISYQPLHHHPTTPPPHHPTTPPPHHPTTPSSHHSTTQPPSRSPALLHPSLHTSPPSTTPSTTPPIHPPHSVPLLPMPQLTARKPQSSRSQNLRQRRIPMLLHLLLWLI